MVNSAILSHIPKNTTVIPLLIWGRKIPFGVEIGVEKRSGWRIFCTASFSCSPCMYYNTRKRRVANPPFSQKE